MEAGTKRLIARKGTKTMTGLHKILERSAQYSILLLSLCALICCARSASGQVDQGAITGVVQDSSGAIVPGAKVTVANIDTGLVLQGITNGSGVYVFSPLKIGNYTVSATASGFQARSGRGRA